MSDSEIEKGESNSDIAVIGKPGILKARTDLEVALTAQRIVDGLSKVSGLYTSTSMFHRPEVIQKSIELQQKYDFQPLGNTSDFSYLTRVISINDFSENPNLYFHKLTKGFGSFPLDFDLNSLADNFLSGCAFKFEKGIMVFQHGIIFENNVILSNALNKALIDSGCASFHTEGYIHIDILTFLKNYDKLLDCVNGEVENESIKNKAFVYFKTMKTLSLAIFRTITNIIIKSPKGFFESDKFSFEDLGDTAFSKDYSIDQENPFKPDNLDEELLFLDIESMLLNTANGVGKEDIDSLIKLQNPEQFMFLLEKLIQKIVDDPNIKKTWIGKNEKVLSLYTTEELIAFATFLARYMIEEYQKVEDMVDDVLHGFSPNALKGKCTDYTGMSLHIINNYFKIKFPDKFKNIIVGYDNQNIGDGYKHCYIKIYGYNSGGLIEVTFIDPTKLSGVSIGDLEVTSDVYHAMNASNLPIQIDRTAEDIIIANLLKGKKH